MLNGSRIESILNAVPQLRIGLIGDLFLDRYLDLAPGVHELSIETGLEAFQITRVRNSPGALGTVMNNLAALGVGQLVPVTVLGDDGQAYDLRQAMRQLPVDLSHVVTDPCRLTPTYTKPMRLGNDGTWRELNRLDLRCRAPLGVEVLDQVVSHLEQVIASTDGLLVLDQVNEDDWGVIHSRVRQALAELHRRHPRKLLFVDSRQHVGSFTAGILKGNRAEILGAVAGSPTSRLPIEEALATLASRTHEPVFCTAGEQGTYVAEPDGKVELVPGYPVTGPVDIVGAGDAASSGMVCGLLTGASLSEAAAFGNLVASITVQQLGTTGTASPSQVRERWSEVAR